MIWIISHLVHCNSSSSCELHMGGHSVNPALHLHTFITHIHQQSDRRDPSEDLDPGSASKARRTPGPCDWSTTKVGPMGLTDAAIKTQRTCTNTIIIIIIILLTHVHRLQHTRTQSEGAPHILYLGSCSIWLWNGTSACFLHLAHTFSTQSKWLLHIHWFLKAGK